MISMKFLEVLLFPNHTILISAANRGIYKTDL